jgi:hypothetical protein
MLRGKGEEKRRILGDSKGEKLDQPKRSLLALVACRLIGSELQRRESLWNVDIEKIFCSML